MSAVPDLPPPGPEPSDDPAAAPVAAGSARAPVIVVGTGPVGVRAARELLERLADGRRVLLFGDEPWLPYNRVVLSSYLAGEVEDIDLAVPEDPRLSTHYGVRITAIDREARTVTDSLGGVHAYSDLVLATGSRPRVPPIPGVDLPGVYTFRDLADADRLKARTASSRAIVVLGGGVLGLETAKALRRFNTRVRVVEHNDHLMFNQLDEEAGAGLRAFVEGLGIEVFTTAAVQQVVGVQRVSGVLLRSGELIPCDTLVLATGIVPNIDLARDAGLALGRGVRADDALRTSDPHIYAVGECAEHRGIVYGLVAPGFEQAAVAAANLAAGALDAGDEVADAVAAYLGSLTATRLKVVGLEVYSAGDVQEGDIPRDDPVYRDAAAGVYRKLVLRGGRLAGAIALGPWHETQRLQEAVTARRRLWPWEVMRFRSTGILWSTIEDQSVFDWPRDAAVCNCTGVTLGQLQGALSQGAATQARLSECTGAGTVCGSCRPLLAELAGGVPDPVDAWRTQIGLSLLALLLAVVFLAAPVIPYQQTVAPAFSWDWLWRDGFAKQVTGFTLLGLAVLVSVLGLRKRLPAFTWGRFDLWRALHLLLGVALIGVLVAHTGLRLGTGLNQWLMLSMIGLLLAGALGGAVIALEHRIPRRIARRARRLSVWAHVLILWPLPVLLGFHIIKGYWY